MSLPTTATAVEVAQAMRDGDIGDVMVLDGHGNVYGIVTDRDLAIRVLAEDRSPADVMAGDICSKALVVVAPTDTVDEAVQIMRRQALRRLPVVDQGKPVGIISLGDLAIHRDPTSVLADISAALGNT
jgi:signal-transduction protein with cAMP-binding, CBS, and nucleotidyltransferase domain